MTVFEALSLMIGFATLVVLIIDLKKQLCALISIKSYKSDKPNVKEVLTVLHTLGLSFEPFR